MSEGIGFLFTRSGSPWETRGIFSDHFIRTRLSSVESWPQKDETIQPTYDALLDLWNRRHVGFEKANEEVTRREFVEKVLDKLGFSYFSNLNLPLSERPQIPDYLLYADEESKDRVFNADLASKHQAATGLLEAKKVNHPLDTISKSEVRFPHQQIRDYLNSATDEIGRPYFQWGILTNGNYWRLYCRDAHPATYFQFHLAGPSAEFCSVQDFKIFITLFSPQVFVESDGICTLDRIRNDALQFQADLEENIRRRVAAVVKDLANGFWSFNENGLAEGDLVNLYDDCLIFLYRLLFVLYAEGRNLLPIKLSGSGANRAYRERFSLWRFVPQLQSASEFQGDDFTDLYEELVKLFHLINGDRPSANKACNVPLYNGGLFDSKAHPRLEKLRIGDKALGAVLRDLIFTSGPSLGGKQKEFEWGTIDYADLEVRQLGDIYEGLLGGHLETSRDADSSGRLEVMGERAALQESGTFYTPDWVVRFLVEKALQPLIEKIEDSEDVARAKKSGLKDDSFANHVLNLNVLDPAMGSGHFLVRATEWLADQIVYHQTTKFKMVNVPPGISQEQAEISYWRRRVVEASIYGVDKNPLAVELAKLSLWLTCIASEEPLNFLEHHVRPGNSLVGARVIELSFLRPKRVLDEEEEQFPLSLGEAFPQAQAQAIHEIAAIESESSTTLTAVKEKERRWNERVRKKLDPFVQVANLWCAALAGLPLTQFEYVQLGELILQSQNGDAKARRQLTHSIAKHEAQLRTIIDETNPFHWELEFPDVFYDESGQPEANAGFDCILGNPPYISTQTSSEFKYRDLLEPLFGYSDDLYVHFVDEGFRLLRQGGRFGFVVSDTFFTLATKLRMREKLQNQRLDYLVQCDPFRATVDAAMFVAQKSKPTKEFLFIQARCPAEHDRPDSEVESLLKPGPELEFQEGQTGFKLPERSWPVFHSAKGCLRIHRTSPEPYRQAVKQVFFEPTEPINRLYNRFMEPMQRLVNDWWEKIETSKKFAANREEILAYLRQLKPGDITLVGLAAEGGQGMRTANNGRFLGYLEGSPQAKAIEQRHGELVRHWEAHPRIRPKCKQLLEQHHGDFEAIVEPLKEMFEWKRELGLRRGEVYRIAPAGGDATPADFVRAFELRKAELEKCWKENEAIRDLYSLLKKGYEDDFFAICKSLLEEVSRGSLALAELGLRSGESYLNESDAPRTAAVFNGLPGKRSWVPFRKGDPEGHRWTTSEPLWIKWDRANVRYLQTAPESRWQGYSFFFLSGVTWTLHANHVGLKARSQPPCVFDASGSRLTPIGAVLTANQFLGILNADIFSFIIKKFVKNTQDYEVNDLRMAPIVLPTPAQGIELETLAGWAIKAKELSFQTEEPAANLVAYCRELAKKQEQAPNYLRPSPQMLLFHSAGDCLVLIELAVSWAVERLYGVAGLGPFDEF